MASKLQDFRQKYPQYDDLDDDQVLSALHKKYYSDLDFNHFASQTMAERSMVDAGIKSAKAIPEMFVAQKDALAETLSVSPEQAREVRPLQLEARKRSVERNLSMGVITPEEAEIQRADLEKQFTPTEEQLSNIDQKRADRAAKSAESNKAFRDEMPFTVPGTGASRVASGVTSVAAMVPSVAVGLLTRNPNLAAATFSAPIFAETKSESLRKGRTEDEATMDGAYMALTEAITERIPLGILTTAGKGGVSRILKAAAAEGIQEPVTQVLQRSYEKGVIDDEMSLQEAVASIFTDPEERKALLDSAIVGMGVGGSIATATEPFMNRSEADKIIDEELGPDEPESGQAPTPDEPSGPDPISGTVETAQERAAREAASRGVESDPINPIPEDRQVGENLNTIDPAPAIEVKTPEGQALLEGPAKSDPLFAKAFHGTPHVFDEFSMDAIGTGEGAQAFGYGLYFAESPKTAGVYAANVKDMPAVKVINEQLSQIAKENDVLRENITQSSTGEVRSDFEKQLSENRTRYEALLDEKSGIRNKPGNVYEVTIPDDIKSEMIDWFEPVSEEVINRIPDELIDIAQEELEQADMPSLEELTGRELYLTLHRLASEIPLPDSRDPSGHVPDTGNPSQEVSIFLDSIGVPGVKFKDGFSRGKEDGDDNLVLFNTDYIDSVRRNDEEVFNREVLKSNKDNNLLSKEREKQKYSDLDLFVVHNLTEKNLFHADSMGGIPVPSLAVASINKGGFSNFGEISLIADPSFIDPKVNSYSKTFNSDIYSPRYPTVNYKVSQSNLDSFHEDYGVYFRELDDYISSELDKSEIERRGLDSFYDNTNLQYAFLKETGRRVKIEYKKRPSLNYGLTEKDAEKFGNEHYVDAQKMMRDKEFTSLVKKRIIEQYDDLDDKKVSIQLRGINEEELSDPEKLKNASYRAANSISSWWEWKPTKVDTYATKDNVRSRMKGKIKKEYDNWVDSKFSYLLGDDFIVTETRGGNLKKMPHTLENVVSVMSRQLRGGESFNYGVGTVRSKVAKRFSSLSSIQKNREKIKSSKEIEGDKDKVSDQFMDIMTSLKPYYKYSADSFGYYDDASKAIGEYASGSSYKIPAFKDIPSDKMNDVDEFLDGLRNMPTEYFESVITRDVNVSEFVGAAVPRTGNKKAIEILKKYGVPIRYYKAGDNKDRIRAIAGFKNVLFSKRASEKGGTESSQALSESVKQWIEPVRQNVQDGPPVSVVGSKEELPLSFRHMVDSQTQGVFIPSENDSKIYLVANNLSNESEAMEVYLHELVGHYGLRGMLGTNYAETMDSIVSSFPSEIKNAAKRNGLDISVEKERRVAAEEFIAYTAQKVLTGQKVLKKERSLLEMIVDFIRKILGKTKMREADIHKIIQSAHNYVTSPVGYKADSKYGDQRNSPVNDSNPLYENVLKANREEQQPFVVEETAKGKLWNLIVFNASDKFESLNRLQKAASENTQLPDGMDTYLKEEMMHHRIQYKVDQYEKEYVKPLIKMIKDSDYSWTDTNLYLQARHAPEANKQIKKINEGDTKYDSGMTDAEAGHITETLKNMGEFSQLEAIAAHIDKMTEHHRKSLVENGLVPQKTIDSWERTYKNYVPLKGVSDGVNAADGMVGLTPLKGKGFDIGVNVFKRRLGRTGKLSNPHILANIVAQQQATYVRAEKARVGRTLLKFMQAYPNSELYNINPIKYVRRINPRTGLAESVIDPNFPIKDNYIRVPISGMLTETEFGEDIGTIIEPSSDSQEIQELFIEFNPANEVSRRLNIAMKNLSAQDIGMFGRVFLSVNRYLSMMYTGLNPQFMVTNVIRDVQMAGFSIEASEFGQMKYRIIKDVPKAIGGIFRNMATDNVENKWAKEWDYFREVGGPTGWVDNYKAIEDLDKKIKQQLGETPIQIARNLRDNGLKMIENTNTAIENGVRLSAFHHLMKHGVSPERAASFAKNMTVNFNRKGIHGLTGNSLYVFFNAAMQGNSAVKRILTNKNGQKAIAAFTAFTASLTVINYLVGGEDEDGMAVIEKIPSSVKERNLIIVKPEFLRKEGETPYYKFPMPYGINVFGVIGNKVGTAVYTGFSGEPRLDLPDQINKSVAEQDVFEIIMAGLNSFNPIGTGPTPLQTVSPTILSVPLSASENVAWHGGPLMPPENPYADAPEPDSQRFFSTSPEWAKWLALNMNKLGGGTEATPAAYGFLDVSPETLEELVSFGLGGVGDTVSQSTDAILTAITDPESLEASKIPFANKVIGSVGDRQTQQIFYSRMQRIAYTKQEVDLALDKGDFDRELEIEQKNPVDYAMIGTAKAYVKQLRKLQKTVKEIKNSDMSSKDKRERVKEQQEFIFEFMEDFNSIYNDEMKSPFEKPEPIGEIVIRGQDAAVAGLKESGYSATAQLFASLPSTVPPQLLEAMEGSA